MSHSYRPSSHSIPKLYGRANYESWQSLVSASLAADGVWKFVDDSAVVPFQDPDERDYQFQARLEAYSAQAAHARMLIISTCKPQIQSTLEKVATAKDCWEKLKSQYQRYYKVATEIDGKTLQAWRKALDAEDCREVKRLLKEEDVQRLLGIREELLNLGWEADGQVWVKLQDVCARRPRTALHVAARRGDIKLMEQILGVATDGEREGTDADREVCPNSTNYHLLKIVDGNYGLDALAIAVVNGNQDVVNLLKKASLRSRTEKVSNPYDIGQDAEEKDIDGRNMAAGSGESDQESGEDGKNMAAASISGKAVQQSGGDREPIDESVDDGSDSEYWKGKTIYESVEDGSDPDYATHISALSAITHKILANLNAPDRKLIEQLYDEDCDFNFLPRAVYLFHFTFSIRSTEEATWLVEDSLRKSIPRQIFEKTVAWGPDSEAEESPGQTTISRTNLDLVKFLLFQLWDGQGRTALHVAVDSCRVKSFIDILGCYQGQDKDLNYPYLNIRDSVGRTPLYRAAATDNSVGVKLLLADQRTNVHAKVVYHAHRWGRDLDIDKLSRRNFFESDCLYITQNKPERKIVNTETRARGGLGPFMQSVLETSSTALHVAIIHKHESIVTSLFDPKNYLPCYDSKDGHSRPDSPMATRGRRQTDALCSRRFSWPVIPDDGRYAVQRDVSALQLSVLVGNSTILQAVWKEDETEQKKKKSVGITPRKDYPRGFHLAAAIGKPEAITAFLENGQDPMIKDGLRNTALHHALRGKYVKFHPHIVDFVSCKQVFFWRREIDAHGSAWQAKPLDTNPLGNDMDKTTGKSKVQKRVGERQATINVLLQTGINIWRLNGEGRAARPLPDAPLEFVTWWHNKVAEQTQQLQERLNDAANSISVTAALVATASYLGPFQPPLGYGIDAVHVDILAVRIFVSCNNLSFYCALAAIMYSLLPSLPMPNESKFNELHNTRTMIAVAMMFLLPSLAFVLTAFAASYVAVIPHGVLGHHSLGLSTTIVGAFFCLIAIARFGFRLAKVLLTLPKDVTEQINLIREFLPSDERTSLTTDAMDKIRRKLKIKSFCSFLVYVCCFFSPTTD